MAPARDTDGREPTPEELEAQAFHKRRRNRSIALALTLVALVVLFYAVTIVRMGPAILDRPM